jgi:transposase-like protein
MTRQDHDLSAFDQIVSLLLDQGADGLADALRPLLNEAMKIERSKALEAEPYQRSESRRGHANGFKPKTLNPRLGRLTLAVPQVRGELDFYPSVLERGARSERALTLAIAQMYVQGVSTRRVNAVLEELCGGLQISSTQVSRAAASLDAELEKWRTRRLDAEPFDSLALDARYEKVRIDGAVVSCAVLIAVGISAKTGRRSVLGVSVALSEAEVHWRDFLASLPDRGLHGVTYLVSDDHAGLRAALAARFAGVPWQRCQFHLQQNALHHCPKIALRPQLAADLRLVFEASSRPDADARLRALVAKHQDSAAPLAAWLEANVPEALTVFIRPPEQRLRLRTSNLLENLNKQIRRRTRVVALFPNTDSLLRLVCAITSELSEDWESAKAYLNMNPPSQLLSA